MQREPEKFLVPYVLYEFKFYLFQKKIKIENISNFSLIKQWKHSRV